MKDKTYKHKTKKRKKKKKTAAVYVLRACVKMTEEKKVPANSKHDTKLESI